ncbi:MAG: chlorophyll synthesis pathway protein BchC [Caulobacteraceae bacterium]
MTVDDRAERLLPELMDLDTLAVVIEAPERLSVRRLALHAPRDDDVVVQVDWSGVSTGTERLLWRGQMPAFPGMGYPLVPGYESVGRIVDAGAQARHRLGQQVFVPGSSGFKTARGLFGGAARRLVTPAARAVAISDSLAQTGVLIALAATARHAMVGGRAPDLIVGHGVLGRLLARLTCAQGAPPPTVWETNPARRPGAAGYSVIDPAEDQRRDYLAIYDVSGDAALLPTLISRLARGGEIVMAGFYSQPLSFDFAPAFLREARLRVAAEWAPDDLTAVLDLIDKGLISLEGLITHHQAATQADAAYRTAFDDPSCLKMVLDWRASA